MQNELAMVAEFHRAGGQSVASAPTGAVGRRAYDMRYSLMDEELVEYLEAAEKGDLVGIADALTDLLYVVFGTVLTHGLQGHLPDCFAEVHRSNMSKVEGGVLHRADGKILKPEGYSPPDLATILEVWA